MDTPRLLKDRYRLGRVIGRGGMGVVWLATDEVLDRPVAVKEVAFPPGLPDEEQDKLRRRTLREARTNARLNHPNVVGVFDIVDEEDRPWIVMEFVPSRSLAETVRADGPFSPERTAEIGLQLLRGLRAAHAAGVLHRDVKPSNVLLAEDGRVVLGDFGIATAKGGSTVTSSGVLIGSPSYMAPERARGRKAGPESDLWSLGATLYTAVEGRPPFHRDSSVAILAALVMDDPDTPERAGPLWPLISSLLRRDPAERPSAEAVAESLREIAGHSGPPEYPAEDPGPPPVPRPRPPLDASPALTGPPPVEPEPEPEPEEPAEPAAAESEASSGGTGAAEPGDASDPGTGTEAGPAGDPTGPSGGAVSPATMAAIGATTRGRRPGPGRRVIFAAAVAVLAVALIAWAAVDLTGGDRGSHPSARHARTSPSRSVSRPPTTPSPTAASPTAPASKPPPPSPTTGAIPDGYRKHHDSTGFSIAVPDGWSATHHGHYLYVEDPKSSRILIVDQTGTPKSDPLADWRRQEAARRGGFSGYHRIRLESVDYPQARKAADWEFTYNGSGGRVHVLNRNILVNDKHAYALYWSTPDDRWKAGRSIFDVFAESFQPATG